MLTVKGRGESGIFQRQQFNVLVNVNVAFDSSLECVESVLLKSLWEMYKQLKMQNQFTRFACSPTLKKASGIIFEHFLFLDTALSIPMTSFSSGSSMSSVYFPSAWHETSNKSN